MCTHILNLIALLRDARLHRQCSISCQCGRPTNREHWRACSFPMMFGCDCNVLASFTSSCLVFYATSCRTPDTCYISCYSESVTSKMLTLIAIFSIQLWTSYQFVSRVLEDRGERKSETSHTGCLRLEIKSGEDKLKLI